MKSLLIGIFFISTIIRCSAQTQIVNSWRDAETTIQNPGLHSIVVAALINDQVVRRQVEDYMASLYPGAATQSYMLFGGDSLLQKGESHYNDILKKEGYDGIVLLRQTGENTDQQFVAGRPPAYLNTWSGYWRGGWGNRWAEPQFLPGTPGRIETDRTWHVQVTVYSLLANKLIWAANTNTTNPGGRVPLFEDVCKAVKKEMKREGFSR
ncbi:hypothetical protein [Flavitalea sp.]|nr:hypothetical protein [Flavitalea sp.]